VRKQLRRAWSHLWRRFRRGGEARRTDEARTRFWAELRAGEREAEARSGS